MDKWVCAKHIDESILIANKHIDWRACVRLWWTINFHPIQQMPALLYDRKHWWLLTHAHKYAIHEWI